MAATLTNETGGLCIVTSEEFERVIEFTLKDGKAGAAIYKKDGSRVVVQESTGQVYDALKMAPPADTQNWQDTVDPNDVAQADDSGAGDEEIVEPPDI